MRLGQIEWSDDYYRQKKEAHNFRCKPSLRLGTFVKVDYNFFVGLD